MRILVILLALLATACATTARYEEILKSWVGSSESELVSSWGPPTSFYEAQDGARMLTYRTGRSGVTSIPQYQSVPTTTAYGYTSYQTTTTYQTVSYNYWCETTFTVKNDEIVYWQWQGNNCRAK